MLPREVFTLLTVEDMPSDEIRRVAQICGIETALKLMQSFSGQSVYFPNYWLKNCLPKIIHIMLSNGDSKKKICKTLKISRMTFYRALNMKVRGLPGGMHRNPPPSNLQMDFFKGTST